MVQECYTTLHNATPNHTQPIQHIPMMQKSSQAPTLYAWLVCSGAKHPQQGRPKHSTGCCMVCGCMVYVHDCVYTYMQYVHVLMC